MKRGNQRRREPIWRQNQKSEALKKTFPRRRAPMDSCRKSSTALNADLRRRASTGWLGNGTGLRSSPLRPLSGVTGS